MTSNTHCRCVFPSPTERELAVVPGGQPGTALRVHVECGREQEGYVRLEQLAYDAGLGWYVQKSFTIPASALDALIPQLRKADCLIPRRRIESGQDAHLLFTVPAMRLARPDEADRREA